MDLRVINFPDAAFKQYLIANFDEDGDGEISLTEALAISKVLCSKRDIKSIVGIEYFSNLQILDCSGNQIEEIDLQRNERLEHLSCHSNPLWNLNLECNPLLKSLYCGNCSLRGLTVKNNQLLEILSCRFNSIDDIDLFRNTRLKMLNVRHCGLSNLHLNKNLELEVLDCRENDLFVLDLQVNSKLYALDCMGNNSLRNIYVSDGHCIETLNSRIKPVSPQQEAYNLWREYQQEKESEIEDDPYEDIGAYNNGFSQEDVDSGRADAFEGDASAFWNID